jgi:hypothetical protein
MNNFVSLFASRLVCVSLAVLLQATASITAAQTAVVLNSKDASLSIIDIASGKISVVNGVGKEPHHLYPQPRRQAVVGGQCAER